MSEREFTIRSVLLGYFPMFIATLSLVTAIFNGYLNSRFVDLIQRNLGRGEYLRTCKEILEAHAQVGFRAKILSQIGERARTGGTLDLTAARNEADSALIRYVSLATYLANLQPDARERYTHLSLELEKILNDAPQLALGDLNKRLAQTDQMFTGMNDDCVKMAKQ